MKIGVFCYNFNHWKTQSGIQNLVYSGYKPEVIFAADRVNLNFYQSKIRMSPKDLYLTHPRELASFYKIDYHASPHNSEATSNLVREYNLELGIVLGARILKPSSFLPFSKGVMNMHPGLLPINRGLDTIKWAIIKRIPQGVTTHIIDDKIDCGRLIQSNRIAIYKDDTLLDLKIRIQNLEQEMMISSIKMLENKDLQALNILHGGSYNKSVPPELESTLNEEFLKYKEVFAVT